MDKVFAKTPKTSILDHFLDFLGTPNPTGLFVKNWALPRFLLYDYLTFFQSFKKNHQPFLRFWLWTQGQTKGQFQIHRTLPLAWVSKIGLKNSLM